MRESFPGRVIRTAHRGRFQMLFVTLIMIAVITPFVRQSVLGHLFFYGLLSVNLLAGVFAVSDQRRLAVLVAALVLIAFLAATWSMLYEQGWSIFLSGGSTADLMSNTIADLLAFIAFTATAALILKKVLAPGPVDTEKMFAAVCVYLLSGVAWAFLYVLVYLNDPDSFAFAFDVSWVENSPGDTSSAFSLFCYFSFVTMTTLGYGDIAPTSDIARTLAWLQAVLGQLYVAILIARLVGLHTQQFGDKSKDRPPSSD